MRFKRIRNGIQLDPFSILIKIKGSVSNHVNFNFSVVLLNFAQFKGYSLGKTRHYFEPNVRYRGQLCELYSLRPPGAPGMI